jgi:hypothetical protein
MAMLRAAYPEAEKLALERMVTDKTIFFDTKTHKALYPKPLIKVALFILESKAHKAGLSLLMTSEEQNILNTSFKKILGILAIFGFWLSFIQYIEKCQLQGQDDDEDCDDCCLMADDCERPDCPRENHSVYRNSFARFVDKSGPLVAVCWSALLLLFELYDYWQ